MSVGGVTEVHDGPETVPRYKDTHPLTHPGSNVGTQPPTGLSLPIQGWAPLSSLQWTAVEAGRTVAS